MKIYRKVITYGSHSASKAGK